MRPWSRFAKRTKDHRRREREREQSAEKTRRREEEAKKDRSRNDGKGNGVEGERGVHELVGRCVRRADKGERRGVRGRDWEARKQVAGGKQRAEGGGDADERARRAEQKRTRTLTLTLTVIRGR